MVRGIRNGGVSSIGKGCVLRIAVVDLALTDEFELVLEIRVGEGFLLRLSLVEDAQVGEVGEGDDMLDTVSEDYVLTDLGVDLWRHSLLHNALDCHVSEDAL